MGLLALIMSKAEIRAYGGMGVDTIGMSTVQKQL